jgi:putative FmdB family regulatory protein
VPTYQYACTECGHGFEQFQSFSDDALTECPTCGGRLRKVFNSVGIVFKGSGFYRNDSREAAAKGKAGKESKDAKDAKDAKESVGSKSDSSSDTKADRQSKKVGTGSEKKADSTAASASSGASGKGSGSSSSGGSSSTAGSAA